MLAIAIGTAISIPLAVLAWRYRIVRVARLRLGQHPLHHPLAGPVRHPRTHHRLRGLLHHGGDRAGRLHAPHPDLEHRGRARRGPADAREAATALGYSQTAALIRVDLPLALPYIFAGLRVATATVIGLVTVTALIGLGGLGQQITYGFKIGYNTPIIVGLVLSIALAAVADLLLVGAQRLVVPWARTRRGREG